MIACLYGRAFAPFVEPIVRDICAAAAEAHGEIQPFTIEAARQDAARCADVHRLYVMPFDAPDAAIPPAAVVRSLFPRAELATSFVVQDLCWDKFATQERLRDRGVPIPETLFTTNPEEVGDFVAYHGFAVLKERFTCAGQGHIVIWYDNGVLVGDSGSHQYEVDLVRGGRRELCDHRLRYPGPFYVQRLVADSSGRAVVPGQILRAYVVDRDVQFWTERYRDQYRRPADWIISVGLGAKYRFVLNVSEEMKKVALRAADVVGVRMGVVDIVRNSRGGPYVLEIDVDSHHMLVDRQFKHIPDYRDFFNFDRQVAEALLLEPEPPRTHATSRY